MAAPLERTIVPQLRCSEPNDNPNQIFCGAPATRMGSRSTAEGSRFFCDAHARPDDRPIEGELAIRVVTLQVDIVIAGVVPYPHIAHAEADRRLRGAVEGIGGLVNLHGVRSQLARWTAPPSSGGEKGD